MGWEQDLIQRLPSIPWLKPVVVVVGDTKRFGCRLCIAKHGLKGADVGGLSVDPEEFDQHMEMVHSGRGQDGLHD